MTVERYEPERHNKVIWSWYDYYGVADRIDPETVSPFGGVVIDGQGACMAGFLFMAMGCRACFVERLVSRPGNDTATSRAAGTALLEFLRNVAVVHGYKQAWTTVERPALAGELEKLGFHKVATGATHMVKLLTE